jgi:hypothetical protein
MFISGKVLLEGGSTLSEPVAIERVCNGVTRREGYTDFKGQFEFQLGSNLGFQDASENDPNSTPGSPAKNTSSSLNHRSMDLTGCEFRAVFAGFVSSTVMLRTNGDNPGEAPSASPPWRRLKKPRTPTRRRKKP